MASGRLRRMALALTTPDARRVAGRLRASSSHTAGPHPRPLYSGLPLCCSPSRACRWAAAMGPATPQRAPSAWRRPPMPSTRRAFRPQPGPPGTQPGRSETPTAARAPEGRSERAAAGHGSPPAQPVGDHAWPRSAPAARELPLRWRPWKHAGGLAGAESRAPAEPKPVAGAESRAVPRRRARLRHLSRRRAPQAPAR